MSYFTAFSRLCNYNQYRSLFHLEINSVKVLREMQKVPEVKKYLKILTDFLANFRHESFIDKVYEIIVEEELFPCMEFSVDSSEPEEIFCMIPYMTVGYWGQYDAGATVDDMDNMSEPEKVMGILFNCAVFDMRDGSYDREKIEKILHEMKDKNIAKKIRNLINEKADLSDVYKDFKYDYFAERYRKTEFTENFKYLFERIMQDTGCGLIDLTPEEDQYYNYTSWEDDFVAITDLWREYKPKEKRHQKFVQSLNQNTKLRMQFYSFLFDEVIAKYRK